MTLYFCFIYKQRKDIKINSSNNDVPETPSPAFLVVALTKCATGALFQPETQLFERSVPKQ